MSKLFSVVFFILLAAMFYGCFSQNALVIFVAVVGIFGMIIGGNNEKNAD